MHGLRCLAKVCSLSDTFLFLVSLRLWQIFLLFSTNHCCSSTCFTAECCRDLHSEQRLCGARCVAPTAIALLHLGLLEAGE